MLTHSFSKESSKERINLTDSIYAYNNFFSSDSSLSYKLCYKIVLVGSCTYNMG